MLKRFRDWVRRQSRNQGGSDRRRFRPFKRIREAIFNLIEKLSGFLPSWAMKFLMQGLLIFFGAPWWVWPIIALAAFLLFGGAW